MINLSKGQKVSLDKEMKMCLVGLGWDPNKYTGQYDFDLDATAFLLCNNGKVRTEEDFIFYGQPTHVSGCAWTTGDDKTGGNSEHGDDEQIYVDFSKIPSYVDRIVFCITIYDPITRNQNFGQISNAYVRIAKVSNPSDSVGTEVIRYDLDEEFQGETAVIACELARTPGEWKFNAVGLGLNADLSNLCQKFGIDA